MSAKTAKPGSSRRRGGAPYRAEPWYARHRWIATRAASERALKLHSWIVKGAGRDEACDESAVFLAMHTCAYRAVRAAGSSSAERRRWLRRWVAVRDHIVRANMGLAYSMLGRFNSPQADTDELASEAMYGLYRAVERYNPWTGYRFSTYACNCIARACMRQRKREQRRREVFPANYEKPWNLATDKPDYDTGLRLERLKRAMSSNAAELNPLERRILDARFPTDRTESRTFKQIAEAVGLSKERVRQIQNVALGKLKAVLVTDPLLT